MLSDNFIEQMDVIVGACQNPALIVLTFPLFVLISLQVNMFSATISPAIESLANSIMKSPLQISVGVRNAAVKNVKQSLLYCGNYQ